MGEMSIKVPIPQDKFQHLLMGTMIFFVCWAWFSPLTGVIVTLVAAVVKEILDMFYDMPMSVFKPWKWKRKKLDKKSFEVMDILWTMITPVIAYIIIQCTKYF